MFKVYIHQLKSNYKDIDFFLLLVFIRRRIMRDGLVVIPSTRPVDASSVISSTFAVSRKNFMVTSIFNSLLTF